MILMELVPLVNQPRELVDFLMENNLLQKNVKCSICNVFMEIVETSKTTDGFMWLCRTRTCNKKNVSIRRGSYFSKVRVELKLFMLFLYLWSRGTSLERLQIECGISNKTAIDYARFGREIMRNAVANQVQNGGPGTTVEIEESLVARRKYNRGRMIER